MIKMIASDLDGTLLYPDKTIPSEIFPLIDELDERGILFIPASGRQYASMRKMFEPAAEKVLFLCENGALVRYRNETLYCNPIEDFYLKDALDKIRAIPHIYPMLCGSDFAYIEDAAQPFFRYAMLSYTNCKKVDNLDGIIGREQICKIAVYDEIGSAENCIKVLPARLPALRTILSGPDWCDVSTPSANKGEALRFVLDTFRIKREEIACFGDHMNDYELLAECGHPFVTENAYPALKKVFQNTVPSNREGGVVKKIKEIIQSIDRGEYEITHRI